MQIDTNVDQQLATGCFLKLQNKVVFFNPAYNETLQTSNPISNKAIYQVKAK